MKNLSLFKALFLALAIFGLSSCGSDEEVFGPTVDATFTDLSTIADVAPGSTFTVELTVAKIDADIRSVSILEDGVVMDGSRITYAGIAVANNPQVVPDADKGGFTWSVDITAHTTAEELDYTFEVTDENNEVSSAFVTVNTEGAATAPAVTYVGTDPLTVAPGSANVLRFNSTGSGEIASFAVYFDDVLVDAAELDYEGTTFTENPLPLAAGSTELSEVAITIRPNATGVYKFEVEDVNGLVGSASVNVIAGVAVTELTGVLLNQAGPPGTGGLDLDTGNGTGTQTTDVDADIKDEGIDSSQPDDSNWKQQISGINGSEIRFVGNDTTLPEGTSYANITTQEQIETVFGNADALSGGVSAVVVIGDEYAVKNGDNYYYIKVTEITETDDNNNDSYTFDIKQ
ncbi:MAG: hypothetical protein AB8F74_11940 [Saprospiraceae bacterium]